MRIIVTGMIATYPVGGMAWDYGQYALGLEQLGHEVYYLEDTGAPIYNPITYAEECSYGVDFLQRSLGCLSPTLGERWHFHAMDGGSYGMERAKFADIVATADLFLNVSGGTLLRDEYMACGRRALIDTDPGWNHFVNYPRWDANPGWLGTHGWRAHNHFFTYATRIGQPDCLLPALGVRWHPTQPPVVIDRWQPEPPGKVWTTVMTWNTYPQSIEFEGIQYGSKEREFPKVERLPQMTNAALEVAVGGSDPPRERWRQLGWSVVNSEDISRTAEEYQSYVQRSCGEFSIAKNIYAATRSGWFSCRSVCYLAASRPVVVQDTGFSDFIPTGEGLFAFTTLEEAERAIGEIQRNYQRHQEQARQLAHDYFDARRVLGHLLKECGL
jgi:hypothetical protein